MRYGATPVASGGTIPCEGFVNAIFAAVANFRQVQSVITSCPVMFQRFHATNLKKSHIVGSSVGFDIPYPFLLSGIVNFDKHIFNPQ